MTRLSEIGRWLHRRAENLAVAMLAVMFGAFILQIVFRYLLDLPLGGASELTIVMWLWLVLWGAGFVLRDEDEVRFDVIYGAVGPRARRIMRGVAALALIALYGWSFPAVWDYVIFMKIQATSCLDIRFDLLYSIYILFAAATLARQAWILVRSLRGRDPVPAPDARAAGAAGDDPR